MNCLTTDEYSKAQFRSVNKYVDDILSGKILSNGHVLNAVKRYKNDLKRKELILDKKKVSKVFKFFSFLRINIKNKYEQFDLLPFQAFILMNQYGFYWRKSGRRRFRYSYLEMAKKSGKTVFSAAKSLYHLVADGEQDPSVLFLASTQAQASIALTYSKSIVINSRALKKIDVLQYRLRFRHSAGGGKSEGLLKALPSNADKLDGYNPSYVLIDEYHAHPNNEVFENMKSAILARNNPLIDIITTAGFNLSCPCYKYREGAVNILAGDVDADDVFTMIFSLDEGDDFTDSKLWIKSNPSLGHISSLEDLQSEFNQANITPSLLSNFLTKNLNLWVSNDSNWIEEKELQQSFKKKIDIEDFKGQDCFIGLDLSSTTDLTSAVLLFETDGVFYGFSYFFRANVQSKKIREGGINLSRWIIDKKIIECQTKTIDYDLLYDYFERWGNDFAVNAIGYDYYNSALIVPRLEAIGMECIKVPQTAHAFNFPLKYLEKLIYDEHIHLDNPVLKWNFRNVVLYRDGNENIKIMKNKSLDAVDGCVSLAQALSMWLQINYSDDRIMYDNYLQKVV